MFTKYILYVLKLNVQAIAVGVLPHRLIALPVVWINYLVLIWHCIILQGNKNLFTSIIYLFKKMSNINKHKCQWKRFWINKQEYWGIHYIIHLIQFQLQAVPIHTTLQIPYCLPIYNIIFRQRCIDDPEQIIIDVIRQVCFQHLFADKSIHLL